MISISLLNFNWNTIIFSFLFILHSHSILPLFILIGVFNASHTNLTQNPKHSLTYYILYQFRYNILTISSFNYIFYHFKQIILHFFLSALFQNFIKILKNLLILSESRVLKIIIVNICHDMKVFRFKDFHFLKSKGVP
jgi:hypothetical protein